MECSPCVSIVTITMAPEPGIQLPASLRPPERLSPSPKHPPAHNTARRHSRAPQRGCPRRDCASDSSQQTHLPRAEAA